MLVPRGATVAGGDPLFHLSSWPLPSRSVREEELQSAYSEGGERPRSPLPAAGPQRTRPPGTPASCPRWSASICSPGEQRSCPLGVRHRPDIRSQDRIRRRSANSPEVERVMGLEPSGIPLGKNSSRRTASRCQESHGREVGMSHLVATGGGRPVVQSHYEERRRWRDASREFI
jgi:hypothetical protein